MFKQLRRTYWLTTEFLSRHVTLMWQTALIVLLLSGVTVFLSRVVETPRPTTRIGLVGKYTPETLPQNIQVKLSTGLVSIENSGEAKPALASSWKVSDDGRTYEFTLDTEKTWNDGTHIKGSDINYNFKDVRVDTTPNSVTFALPAPYTPFLSAVSKPIIKDGRYGVGEYHLTKSVVYSGVLQAVNLASSKQVLIYKFYPTESAALTAYRLGEIDKIENLSRVPENLASEPRNLITQNHELSRTAVLFLNNNDQLLQSKSVRQALAYAIKDKSFGHPRAISPIASSSWAFNPLVKDYAFDESRAKTLFGQDVKDPSGVTIELKTTLQYLDVADIIATDWQAVLGIKVNVKVVTTLTSDYQVLLADYAPPTDPDQYTTWHSTQGTNYTHYTNLKVDKLLEDGRRTADLKLRRDIYQDFQRFLLEDSPAIFLFETTSFDLSRKPLFKTS